MPVKWNLTDKNLFPFTKLKLKLFPHSQGDDWDENQPSWETYLNDTKEMSPNLCGPQEFCVSHLHKTTHMVL